MSDSIESTVAPSDEPREILFTSIDPPDIVKDEVVKDQVVKDEVAKDEVAKDEPDTDADEGKPRKNGVQHRIDELTRRSRENEREAAYWKGIAQAQTKEPAPGDYSDYNDYIKAVVRHNATQMMSEASAVRHQEVMVQTFAERLSDARARIKDYDEVVGKSNAPLSQHVGELIQESEQGAELAYHFAKHPSLLQQINSMSERQAAMAIGRLGATLSQSPPVAVKRVSSTPTPASVSLSAGRSTSPSLDTASMDDYKALRAKQGARWAR